MIQDMDTIARLYYKMLLIRRVEEHICKVYDTDVIKSPVHLSIGQEAVAVGICDELQPTDIISHTYRCHASYLAKGGNLKKMMAELYGKETGCAGGKAGSMHLVDMDNGILGASAVVGTTIPVAVGYALAQKMQNTGNIVICFFGDGATEEGVFYESINFAALKSLPIIFVCENNGLAIHTPTNKRQPNWRLPERVNTYDIGFKRITNGNIFAIKEAARIAISRIKSGFGPQFIECDTYRYLEHVGVKDDHNERYRNLHEYQKWKESDQIDSLSKILGNESSLFILSQVDTKIDEAIKFAEQSSFPSDDMLLESVYA